MFCFYFYLFFLILERGSRNNLGMTIRIINSKPHEPETRIQTANGDYLLRTERYKFTTRRHCPAIQFSQISHLLLFSHHYSARDREAAYHILFYTYFLSLYVWLLFFTYSLEISIITTLWCILWCIYVKCLYRYITIYYFAIIYHTRHAILNIICINY